MVKESNCYSVLADFIGTHGKFVEDDFPVTGLTNSDARLFLGLLRECRIRPLGIELWRATAHGYDVDGAKGWYSERGTIEADYQGALAYLNSEWLGSRDLFVFQY
ncbi:hypothetical protein [Marilutibacter alkalisoli]|uniref:Uncharacterized protein n=1 Tax=Marilutibacter alkalisoli TaxID=2591633 RepID=A0A514BND7_9GAMM|nr:hypothetical protein [Lysobacter alkalisoli]QDH68880.1 hypothetical protein FKV23_01250 [Lysobacter alkalisoli]